MKFIIFSILFLFIFNLIIFGQNHSFINDEDLVFYYNFDSIANDNVYDLSVNALHGNRYNIKNSAANGVIGNSFLFDCNDSSRVFIGNDEKLNNNKFTIMAWFKLTSWGNDLTDGREILEKTHAYWLVLKRKYPNQDDQTGYVSAGVYDTSNPTDKQGNTHIDAPNDIEFNTWYHVASVYDGNTITIFVNGENQGSATTKPFLYDLDDNLVIGSKQNRDGFFINQYMGNLDEVIMIKRPLAAQDIESYYQSTKNLTALPPQYNNARINIKRLRNSIQISSSKDMNNLHALFYNISGQLLCKKALSNTLINLDIPETQSPFFIQIANNQNTIVYREK